MKGYEGLKCPFIMIIAYILMSYIEFMNGEGLTNEFIDIDYFIPSLTSSMKPKMLSSASVKLAGDFFFMRLSVIMGQRYGFFLKWQ